MDNFPTLLPFIFITLILISFFQSYFFTHALPEYSRPPPRSLISATHKGSDSDPQQVHISLEGKQHMRVSWVTSDHLHTKSIVEYGTSPGVYDSGSVTGDHISYTYFFYRSGRIHHAIIGPLEPSTIYYYRCGGSGQEFSFKTPPSSFPVEFVIVGDLGQTEWTSTTLKHVGAEDYDVFLLPGDLSYADTQQPLWDSFGRLVEPYASSRPWMVTEGNHDIESFPVIHPNGFQAYNTRWAMPYEQSGSSSNLYYSFDVSGAHIVMLGSYTDFDSESDQYKWLEADFASVYRTKTPWLIVLLHAPWYNSNDAHKGEGESMRKSLEPLLYKAKVDAVFSGHVHSYERFTRVFDNKPDSNGPAYVTVGDGGNREGLAFNFEEPKPSISMYREPSFGHGRLRIYNCTHALWSWHRNNDSNAFIADQVWLHSLSSLNLIEETTTGLKKDEL